MKPQIAIAVTLTCLFTVVSFAEDKDDRPAELKVLDQFVGTWSSETVSKAAEWTPKDVSYTGELTRKWVLNRQYVQEFASDGQQMVMFGYDKENRVYRCWFFPSKGRAHESTGHWDEKSKTLSTSEEMNDGITSYSRIRFVDKDTHVWSAIAKNKQGKEFFHMEGKVTRKK